MPHSLEPMLAMTALSRALARVGFGAVVLAAGLTLTLAAPGVARACDRSASVSVPNFVVSQRISPATNVIRTASGTVSSTGLILCGGRLTAGADDGRDEPSPALRNPVISRAAPSGQRMAATPPLASLQEPARLRCLQHGVTVIDEVLAVGNSPPGTAVFVGIRGDGRRVFLAEAGAALCVYTVGAERPVLGSSDQRPISE